jgi:hypothetical protein
MVKMVKNSSSPPTSKREKQEFRPSAPRMLMHRFLLGTCLLITIAISMVSAQPGMPQKTEKEHLCSVCKALPVELLKKVDSQKEATKISCLMRTTWFDSLVTGTRTESRSSIENRAHASIYTSLSVPHAFPSSYTHSTRYSMEDPWFAFGVLFWPYLHREVCE